MTYKIGSFNLLHFSLDEKKEKKSQNEGNNTRSDVLAAKHFSKIIRQNNFDIIALQEIHTQEALKELLKILGPEYRGIHSKEYNNLINNCSWKPQDEYAFIWNKRRIQFIKTPSFYTEIYQQISPYWDKFFNLFTDRKKLKQKYKLRRSRKPPLIGIFRPLNLYWELRLINYSY